MDKYLLAVLLLILFAFILSGFLFLVRRVFLKLSTQVLAIIGLYVFSVFYLNLTLEQLGLGNITKGLVWGVLISVSATVVLLIASNNVRLRELFKDERTKDVPKRHIAFRTFIDIPIGTVLFEELLFRGLIYGFFSAIISVNAGIIISSVLFGFWHVLPSLTFASTNHKAPTKILTVIGTVIFTGLSGAIFALLRVLSGSIIAPIALHYAVNTASLLLSWIISRKNDDAN